ncbi:DnaJ domain-containing protein [Sorangium sp. So ce131]|uniref:DnaJ domain-containing protein n=1 Tax=Sorangium sp. So ce131 TaxID=3133282 RepID=UPI003F5FE3FC
MTAPQVDVISQNLSENVRREQARDLAASVVQALFRLVKLSTLHSIDNQAMVRQVEETVALVQDFGQRSGHNVSILFARGSVFVSGQLLKANRAVYEGALELGEILGRCGYSEIGVTKDVRASDLYALASALAEALRSSKPALADRPAPRVRLRAVDEGVLRREVAVDREGDETSAIVRTYATAIVILRRFYEDLRRGRYALRQGVKRITQRLVDLSANETPAFLGVTALRNQNHDDAGRAVNTAILSLAMARQITGDVVLLQRLSMAALLFDIARPRLTGVAKRGGGGLVPQLSEQQDADVPAGTAVVLTALGLVNEPSVMRTVVAYEAHWVRRQPALGPVYRGLRQPTLQARILATARAFNDLLTAAPGEAPLSADEAIAKLEQEATDPADRTVLRLLVGALGIFPTGTLVELSTGEVALVVQTPAHPAFYSQPRVRLVLDASGGPIGRALEVDLAERPRAGEPARHIRRIVATSDDPAAASMRAHAAVQEAPQVSLRAPAVPSVESPPLRSSPASPLNHLRMPPPQQITRPSSPTLPTTTSPASRRTQPRPGDAGRGPVTPPDAAPPSARPEDGGDEGVMLADLPPAPSGKRSPTLRPGRTTARWPDPQQSDPAAAAQPHAPPGAHREESWSVQTDSEPDEVPESARPEAQRARGRGTEPQRGERSPLSDMPPSAMAGPIAVLALPGDPPTAEGTLARTPLVHLLVYMLDRRLTGTTCFVDPEGVRHGIFFSEGVPAKIWTGTIIAPLDRVILELGLLDEATLRETLRDITRRRVLHGRLLVSRGLLDRETVFGVLRQQLVRKLVALYDLAPETRYAYYDGQNLLASYGGPELIGCEPLAVIMAGVRLHADDPLIDATLDRIHQRQIGLHIEAEMKRFQLHRDEAAVVDLLRTRRMTLAELVSAGVAQERVVRLTIYALAITRHLDLGVPGRGPVGVGRDRAPSVLPADAGQPPQREAPGAAARSPRPTSGSTVPGPRAARGEIEGRASPSELPPPSRAARAAAPAAPAPAAPRGSAAAQAGERERGAAPQVDAGAAGRPPRGEREAAPPRQADDVIPPSRRHGSALAEPAAPLRPPAPAAPEPRGAAASFEPRAPGGDLGGAPRGADPKGTRPASPPIAPGARAHSPQAPTVKMAAVGTEGRPARGGGRAEAAPPPAAARAAEPAKTPAAAAPEAPPPRAAAGAAPSAEIAARRAEIEARAAAIDGESFFEMLGVAEDAPPERVQSAYFALAKQWHPDRTPPELQDIKPLVARVFARISEAYQTLSDPKRRAEYQKTPKEGASPAEDEEKIARVVDAALEFQKAEILLKKNDLVGAEVRARRALNADPDQPEYMTLLVWIQALRRGEPPALAEGATSAHYDDLIQTLDVVLRKEPRYERALFYRGMLLKRSGRIEKAIRDFRLAAEINPKNLDAIREVRVQEMRSRTNNDPTPAGGLLGKFFKR